MARRIEWAMAALTGVLAVPLFAARGSGAPRVGTIVDLVVTATPEDKGFLECSLNRAIGDHRCAYRTARTRWDSRPSRHDLVQPFVASDRGVYLISGLFDMPEVLPHLGRRRATVRFTATCRVRMLAEVSDVAFRFHPTDPWIMATDPLYVVEALSCSAE